ncbi:Chromate resistance protein ChrB [Streptosporangium sp. NPDC005286]|uniref:Chromate resistance protein ChrB n=1 Tax=Streptosporangium sp. NPDC005286 TaxID=3154463 RepID=UPI0033B16806
MDGEAPTQWVVLVARVPPQSSQHRDAVLRELRDVGALSLDEDIWAVPDTPVFADGIQRALGITDLAEGEAAMWRVGGHERADSARFRIMFTAARESDWAEFIAECDRFASELDRLARKARFRPADLEERTRRLDVLRSRHHDLQTRDAFGASAAGQAARQVTRCVRRLEECRSQAVAYLRASNADAEGGRA